MPFDFILGGAVAVALLLAVYLIYALIRPERFQANLAYFARAGHGFRAILGTRFTPSCAAIPRTRAGWPTVS